MTLVGWWPLTEQTGQANDYSGNGNHGTVTGASRGFACPSGITSYDFDGANDYINCGNLSGTAISDPSISGEISYGFWMNYGGPGTDTNDYIISSGSQTGSRGLGAWVDRGNDSSMKGVVNDGTNDYTASGAYFPSTDDGWVHIFHTWDGTTIRQYINGTEVTSGTGSSDSWADNDTTLTFARPNNATTNTFDGSLCDIRIYDRALSPLEVESLHDVGIFGQPTDGTAKYAFEGDATDSFGSNDGTVNGATFTDGIRGQAASFDGTDDHIDTGSNLVTDSYFTLTGWFKVDNFNDGALLTERDSADNTWLLYAYNGGSGQQLRFLMWYDSTSSVSVVSDELSTGQWYHVSVSYDKSSLRLYINGMLVDSLSTTVSTYNVAGKTMRVGYDGYTHYDGLADDVRVYPYALTSRQIQAIYRGWSDVVRPPEDGVAYYPLDGNVTDQWGTNDGTVNGATPATGLRGRCYSFDGTDDYIDAGSQFEVSTGAWSLGVWFKADAVSSGPYNFVSNGDSDVEGFRYISIYNSNLAFYDPGASTWRYNNTTLSAGEWYHGCFVYDGSGTVTFYLNGASDGTGALSTSSDDAYLRYIGMNVAGNRHFDGNIDDVRIYDYALAPHEVHALYRWGMGGRDLRKNLVNA